MQDIKYDFSRLLRCMERARKGEELTIGFFGGSITQGSLATSAELTYAYRVFQWWQKSFPKAEFHYVNGGIGGTSSHFGVARVVPDLLMYQPDFVVVDFSVNDEESEFFQETYEGLIRKIVTWPSAPAVLLLNNVFYDTGVNAQKVHNEIGDHYRIPHVSIRDTIYQEMKNGKYKRDELTEDGLHPNDMGHGLVAEEIIKVLELVKSETDEICHTNMIDVAGLQEISASGTGKMPSALTANAYENAKRLTIRECSPILQGFRADAEEKSGHLDGFKNGWIGKHAGDRLCLEVEASCIAVQYRKTVQRPACRAKLILDQKQEFILDGNFEENWGDCQFLESVLHHGERRKHRLEVEILPDPQEKLTPFYLMSFIIA